MAESQGQESGEWQGNFDPFSDPDEERVILAALESFQSYRRAAHYNTTHVRRQSFYALPQSHWTRLAAPPFNLSDTLSAVDDAIDANADIAEAIAQCAAESFVPSSIFEREIAAGNLNINHVPPWKGKATSNDLDKARSTIRQFFRDWSAEGSSEREACYNPFLKTLAEEHSQLDPSQRHNVKTLVPGAGLGRLVFELCAAGYTVEGNEISYHQLMASSFILNHLKPDQQFALYPWALSFSNHTTRANQLRKVLVPDVHPGTALEASSEGKEVHAFERLSMTAADFCVLYTDSEHEESFDAVTTCFFIDTAPNLFRYIEAIHNTLKKGGLWINLGPLLWHFENNAPGSHGKDDDDKKEQGRPKSSGMPGFQGIGEAGSMELSDDEVVLLVEEMGFKMEKREVGNIASGYVQDPQSMLLNIYRPSFWVARKL